ncbi:hypothetical protein EAI93_14335, partial [[Ruminococcus] torques]
MPNRGGDLLARRRSDLAEHGFTPAKGAGLQDVLAHILHLLSSVDIELVLSPAALRHMDARLMLDLPT